MSEPTAEVNRDPKARSNVHDQQDGEIDPGQCPLPEAVDGHEQADEERGDCNESTNPFRR
jgi:hypothetical protein